MVTYKQVSEIESGSKTFYDTKDLSLFLNVEGRTLENSIKKLLEQYVLSLLERGKYYVTSKKPNELQIACYVYNPSYISFETALNYHGILSQFPTSVSCATLKKTERKSIDGKEYLFSHVSNKFYIGYEKKDNFLIAIPEKALVDQLYFSIKSLRSICNLNEYDLSILDKSKTTDFIALFNNAIQGKMKNLLKSWL